MKYQDKLKKLYLLSTMFLVLITSVSALLTDNLVSYWSLDVDTKDDYSNHDGTNYGATNVVEGINGAFEFDGFDDYILVDDHDDLDVGIGDFSISAWVKSETGSGEKIIVSKFGNESGPWTRQILDARPGYSLKFQEGNLWFQIRTCSLTGFPCPVYGVKTVNIYDDNLWHHVVTIADRDTYSKIYVDGQEVDTICLVPGCISSFNLDNTNYFTIGDAHRISTDKNWGIEFNGNLDEIGFWKRALSPTEVSELYTKGIDLGGNNEVPEFSSLGIIMALGGIFVLIIKKKN
ncbi:LamG domain-containing protein [archaeon]|nr:LamG domain-containing protein [archaeon]